MTVSSTAGIATAWTALRAGAMEEAVRLTAVKAKLQADEAVVALVQGAAQPPSGPPPSEGQGRLVDRRV